jgi:hypothetical protein
MTFFGVSIDNSRGECEPMVDFNPPVDDRSADDGCIAMGRANKPLSATSSRI